MEKKRLVAYFSCSGATRKIAESLAKSASADLYEIKPEISYRKPDLNWMDKKARSTVEMNDPSSRPAIAGKLNNMNEYNVVFVGFPIWWYVAPTIINTFLESYDFSEKTIIPFATSGGVGFGETGKRLKLSCSNTVVWKEGKLLNSIAQDVMVAWINTLGL